VSRRRSRSRCRRRVRSATARARSPHDAEDLPRMPLRGWWRRAGILRPVASLRASCNGTVIDDPCPAAAAPGRRAPERSATLSRSPAGVRTHPHPPEGHGEAGFSAANGGRPLRRHPVHRRSCTSSDARPDPGPGPVLGGRAGATVDVPPGRPGLGEGSSPHQDDAAAREGRRAEAQWAPAAATFSRSSRSSAARSWKREPSCSELAKQSHDDPASRRCSREARDDASAPSVVCAPWAPC